MHAMSATFFGLPAAEPSGGRKCAGHGSGGSRRGRPCRALRGRARGLPTRRACPGGCRCHGRAAPRPTSAANLFAIELPELREVGKERAAHNGANARHRAQEILFRTPDRTLLDGVVGIAVGGLDAALQPADMAGNLSADGRRRMLEPIALGREHVEQLPPPRSERIELLEHRIRQRAG